MIKSLRQILSALAMTMLLLACGGGGGTNSPAPAPAPFTGSANMSTYQGTWTRCIALNYQLANFRTTTFSLQESLSFAAPAANGSAQMVASDAYFATANCSGNAVALITAPSAAVSLSGTKTLEDPPAIYDKLIIDQVAGTATYSGSGISTRTVTIIGGTTTGVVVHFPYQYDSGGGVIVSETVSNPLVQDDIDFVAEQFKDIGQPKGNLLTLGFLLPPGSDGPPADAQGFPTRADGHSYTKRP
jgi:hypothetical protein